MSDVPRRVVRVVAASALLACAGCGTHGTERQVVRQPRLPAALASQLADQSASVAARLHAGDRCGALRLALRLQAQTIDAINSGRVPAAFQEPLQASVNDIAARIRCVPPAPASTSRTTPKEHGKKKGHERHEHKRKGEGD